MALKALMQLIHVQGMVMTFSDLFLLLAILFVMLAGRTVVEKKPAAKVCPPGSAMRRLDNLWRPTLQAGIISTP
jgi:hypothetical protein